MFNMTGHPAATVPMGFTSDGLPCGLLILGSRYDDEKVLSISKKYEEVNPWSGMYESVVV
jgi:aspartyl-tRNA(Asn)/glutamyl-tRNA(Gln) amidotransferase subunit A